MLPCNLRHLVPGRLGVQGRAVRARGTTSEVRSRNQWGPCTGWSYSYSCPTCPSARKLRGYWRQEVTHSCSSMFFSPGCCNLISQWEKLTFLLMTSCSPTSMGAEAPFRSLMVSYTVRCRLWQRQLIERSPSLATWSNSAPETLAANSPVGIHHLEVIIFICTSGSLGEEACYLSCTTHILHSKTYLTSVPSAFWVLCVGQGRLSNFLIILPRTMNEKQNQKRDSLLQVSSLRQNFLRWQTQSCTHCSSHRS